MATKILYKSGYYVSAINGSFRGLVDGPHATHEDALAKVDDVRFEVAEDKPESWWWEWGTAFLKEDLEIETRD